MFLGSDHGGETAAICFSILANAKRYRIEPFAYVRALLIALSSPEADLESLLPDVWIAAHPEHVLTYRRDESEAAANARRRRRAHRRERTRQASQRSGDGCAAPGTSASGIPVGDEPTQRDEAL